MRFRVQMTCTSSTISPPHSANLRLGEVNGPVAARKRVTGTCHRDLAEQQKNSNVREHKKMIHACVRRHGSSLGTNY